MAELLIVVAILVALFGVAFVAVQNHQRSMTQLEYDTIAKEIFIAAQNHLTTAESQGYLGQIADESGYGIKSPFKDEKNDIKFSLSSIDFKKKKIVDIVEKLKNSPWNNNDFTEEIINDLSDIDKFLKINIRLNEFKNCCTDNSYMIKYLNEDYLTEESIKDITENLISYISVIFCHLLKWKYQPSKQSTSWVRSISSSYMHIVDLIYKNKKMREQDLIKSVYNNIKIRNNEAYEFGKRIAIKETRLAKEINDDINNKTYASDIDEFDSVYYNFINIDRLLVFNRLIDYIIRRANEYSIDYIINNNTIRKYYTGTFRHLFN